MLGFLNHALYSTCRKELHDIHSCQLVLRTLKYLLVRCWFIFSLGLRPGVPPSQVRFSVWRMVLLHLWGRRAGAQERAVCGNDMVSRSPWLVHRITHSTSVWGVVYFSSPVANVFLFGSCKVACPGFWTAALAGFSGLDLLVLMARDIQEGDCPTSLTEELAQRRNEWALATDLVFTGEATASQDMQKWSRMLWLHEILSITKFPKLIVLEKISMRNFLVMEVKMKDTRF